MDADSAEALVEISEASKPARFRPTAQLMKCSPSTLTRYLNGSVIVPLGRWELLLMFVQIIYHPDEPLEVDL